MSNDSYRRLFFHLYEFFKILILKLDTVFHINTTFLELCRGTLPQRVNYASYDFLAYAVSVMRLGSDTFGDPIFQKGLQN